jgi:hypothetical protein
MTSWKYLIQELGVYLNAHPANIKHFAEFTEQMPNLATMDEKYPLVFIAPVGSESLTNVITYDVNLYCLDLINDKRDNINDVLSETGLILNDVYQYFTNNHPNIDIIGTMPKEPLNNFDLDYVAGWMATVSFELPQYCENLINIGD